MSARLPGHCSTDGAREKKSPEVLFKGNLFFDTALYDLTGNPLLTYT